VTFAADGYFQELDGQLFDVVDLNHKPTLPKRGRHPTAPDLSRCRIDTPLGLELQVSHESLQRKIQRSR